MLKKQNKTNKNKPGSPDYRDFYEKLFNASADGIAIADTKNKKIFRVNPALCAMFGYDEKTILKLGLPGLHPPEALPAVTAAFEAQAAGALRLAQDVPCLKKGGAVFYADIHSVRLAIDGLDCLMGMFHETTARKQAAALAQESERRYRVLFEASRDALMTLEPPAWAFTSGNPACVAMFRAKDEADFISHGPWDLSPERQPDGRLSSEKAPAMIAKAMSEGSNYFDWTHRRLNGEVFPADVLLTRTEIGSGVFLQATVRDLTERKLAEERLNRLNRVRGMAAAMTETILRVRAPRQLYREACRIAVETGGLRMAWVGLTDKEGRVNPAAQWGFLDGYLDSITVYAKDVPEGRGPVGMAIRAGLPSISNDISNDAAMLPWKENALARGYAALAAFPLRLGSAVIGAYAVYSGEKGFFDVDELRLFTELAADISFALEAMDTETRRRKAEAEAGRLFAESLERARLLEEQAKELKLQKALAETSARAKAVFLANMTHELNTPLNSIIGFSEVLADQNFGPLNEKQKVYAGNILAGGRQLLDIIYSIFQLVRLDSETGSLSPADFALEPALAGAVGELEPQARAKELHLSLEVRPPGCRAQSDEKLLREAVLLLLSNAIKFTPAGGKAGIFAEQSAGGIEITVRDTGIGLSGEDIARLFQPFGQLEDFETKKYSGIGIGLVLAKRIIEMLGGELRAESAGPGRGSAFKFTLPPTWGGGVHAKNPVS